MHKKLLTLAIGAAMAAVPFVTAQAAPNVQVYGQAHVSIDSLDDDSGNADDSNVAVSSNSSRFGVKGKESLGNGLSAFYKMEWHVGVAGNKNTTNQRNQYVGLKGSFGSVLVGRRDTPIKDIGKMADLFWRTQAGENRNITEPDNWDERYGNFIMYSTPMMNGLYAHLAYVADRGGAGNDDNDDDLTSIAAGYKNGPYHVAIGHEQKNRSGAGQNDSSIIRLAGTYKMNAWKFAALWQTVSDWGFNAGSDRDVWGLGAAFKMGNTTFKGQYYVADDLDNTSDTGANMISIGVDHALSSNTSVYAVYAMTDNDANANYTVVGDGHDDQQNNTANGKDPSVLSFGMRVKF